MPLPLQILCGHCASWDKSEKVSLENVLFESKIRIPLNLFAKINRCAFAAEQSKSGGQARLGNPLNQGLSYAVRKTAAGFDFSKRKCSAAITPQPLYHAVQPFCNAVCFI